MKDWWKRVVRIIATTKATKTKPASKSVGTGFLIGPDRILTAEHVVLPTAASAELEIRFDGMRGVAASSAEVVWRASEADDASHQPFPLDVAVLKAKSSFPDLEADLPLWSLDAKQDRRPWRGAGFPSGLTQSEPEGLHGDAYALIPGRTLQLDVASPPALPEYWKGASGTAVLIDDRIAAVVIQCSDGAKGRIYATPLALLASNEAFRSACNLSSREEDERYEADRKEGRRLLRLLRERSAACLERSARARATIVKHFPDYVSDQFARPSDRASGDALVASLIEPPPQQVVALLDRARRELRNEGAPEADTLAVRECLSHFLPTVTAEFLEDDRVYRIQRLHPNVRVYRSRIGSRGVAALLHARRVGGPLKVRSLPGSHELLTGLHAVELSLRSEAGLEEPVDLQKLVVDVWEALGYGKLAWASGAEARKEILEVVNSALAADRKKGPDGIHPYVVVRLLDAGPQDPELKAMEFIQRHLRELNLVVCDGRFKADEADWLVALRNFFLDV